VRCLALTEQGGRVEPLPPLAREQRGGALEDGGPLEQRRAGPGRLGRERRRNGPVHMLKLPLDPRGEAEAVAMRRRHRHALAGFDPSAADDQRQRSIQR
jgi:hypothetical protein